MKLLGSGNNCIPMVHVGDLAKTVAHLIAAAHSGGSHRQPPYVFSVDSVAPTSMAVAQAVAEKLGSGSVRAVPNDELWAMPVGTEIVLVPVYIDADGLSL